MLRKNLKFLKYEIKVFVYQKRLAGNVVFKEQLFINNLGCSKSRASKLAHTKKISLADPNTLLHTINCCKQFGYTKAEIAYNSRLFNVSPITLEHHYMALQEGGFHQITPIILIKFLTIIKMSVGALKTRKLIKKEIDVSESFIKYLEPKPEGFSVHSANSDLWKDVHRRVFVEYLQWRLQARKEDIERLIRIHPYVLRKSFRYVCEIINLAESFGFPPQRIIKYGYLLKSYPPYTKEIVTKFGDLCGTDIRKQMCHYPKLFSTRPENIEKIYNILKSHNISDNSIKKAMNIFSLSPETIESRFKEIDEIPELKVHANNARIVKLLVHQNRAKSRLYFLKQLHLKCSGMGILVNDDDSFDIHVRQGRDINGHKEIANFLTKLFNVPRKQFMDELKKHPFYLQVSFVAMLDTYNFLKANSFSDDVILNSIYILLYPKEKLENAFGKMERNRLKNEKLSQQKRLNLALYFMEIEHHFTGNGIWLETDEDHSDRENLEENVANG